MKKPPYPKYRSTGATWVPVLPDGWELTALRWLSRRYSGGTPDKGNDAYWESGDIPWLNSGAVNDGYITEPSAFITSAGFLSSSAKWIPKGGLVMALAGQGKTKGLAAQLGIDTTCNQSMAAIIPNRRLQPRYVYWWLTANYTNIRNMAGGEARDGLNLDILGNIPCPIPGDTEQIAISELLDRKTAQIDSLLTKKRTMIERLKEKHSALISRTVIRGLAPDVARAAGVDSHPDLKRSGFEWVPKIPARWELRRLRHISDAITVGVVVNPSSYVSEEGVPFLLGGDVREFRIDTASCNRCSEEASNGPLRKSRLSQDDVVVVRVGYPGVAAVVTPALEGANCASMMIVRRHRRFYSQWLAYVFNSQIGRDQIDIVQYGAAQKQFNISHAIDFVFPYPPIQEQRAIADFLDRETARIEQVTNQVEVAIARLQEYRAALITAAVTGKLDARGPSGELPEQ